MTKDRLPMLSNRRLLWMAVALILGLSQVVWLGAVQAQEDSLVQELTGEIAAGAPGNIYLLPNAKQGETLTVYVEGTSGNLDPLATVGLASTEQEIERLIAQFRADVEQAVLDGHDPLQVVPEFADQYFLAWDDDSGLGYAAAFEYTFPADGDYQLLVTDSPFGNTFGQYRLLVGINAPEVLSGEAEPTGGLESAIALARQSSAQAATDVQEITGTLTEAKRSTFLDLNDFKPGDALYVFIETTSGDLTPAMVLRDFGRKAIRSGSYQAGGTQASFQHTFPEGGQNYRLDISAQEPTTGDYRLLLGRNVPEVLTGQANPVGLPVARAPIDVKVGIRLQQITNVDQQSENFGAVVGMRMEWTDPTLAFSPDECQCASKIFTQKDFDQFIAETGGLWPEFTLFNQQNNRWTQNRLAVIEPNGHAIYFERFTTTFQAPDFDFRQFPFDTQEFFIRIDSILPEEYLIFSDLETFTAVGSQLGEEEWYISNSGTEVTSEMATTGNVTSRYSFRFEARRHLTFYIFRVFLPLLLIIIVAWITFFLRDYGKRIEATSANLLLFIAFNFTIGASLPRLGYLTFLDTVLAAAFLISVVMVGYNVYLKWLETNEQRDRAERIDHVIIWLYPFGYLLAFGSVALLFFVIQPPLLTA